MSKITTVNNSRGHPTEFQQIITEKSRNFVGREFVFTAINHFLHQYDRGYFTIVGAPGSGKSAIAAKYVTENPTVVYYNTQIEGKNLADQFLITICTQLIQQYSVGYSSLPDNATEGSWFFSLLLQKISTQLEPQQQLIIAIDALDEIDRNSQTPSTNLFYLPRYLPEKVYFLLTRRPFPTEKSGLLIETPSQTFDLKNYHEQNQADTGTYIRQFVKHFAEENSLKSWLNAHHESESEFIEQLAAKSENNFRYVSEILAAIAQGSYVEGLDSNHLPPSLAAYYQKHLDKMLLPSHKGDSIASVELAVLNVLIEQEQPISVEKTAEIIDGDEYEIETVLENWVEFLEQENIEGETCYRLYHARFRDWLPNCGDR